MSLTMLPLRTLGSGSVLRVPHTIQLSGNAQTYGTCSRTSRVMVGVRWCLVTSGRRGWQNSAALSLTCDPSGLLTTEDTTSRILYGMSLISCMEYEATELPSSAAALQRCQGCLCFPDCFHRRRQVPWSSTRAAGSLLRGSQTCQRLQAGSLEFPRGPSKLAECEAVVLP
ncbi:hypothetical protein VTI74DRAFT_6802 [Chaetomium olivicolor]